METTIGGDRLGSGSKNKVHLRDYERSTHDLGYIMRTTMASGTLVPFMTEVALPGDSHEIELNCDIKTHPTIGPLFGSYKVQLDVFSVPLRLYQGELHMNMLGIGLDMAKVKLPQYRLQAQSIDITEGDIDNQQIEPSTIFSYLNVRGLGSALDGGGIITREFNAATWLGYWDIYKNYYADKQQEIGAVIHNNLQLPTGDVSELTARIGYPEADTYIDNTSNVPPNASEVFATFNTSNLKLKVEFVGVVGEEAGQLITLWLDNRWVKAAQQWVNVERAEVGGNTTFTFTEFITMNAPFMAPLTTGAIYVDISEYSILNTSPRVQTFELSEIDEMRKNILRHTGEQGAFLINENLQKPWEYALKGQVIEQIGLLTSKQSPMEGLGLKTYQSDLFNNWLSTEWIDGENGINAITSIDVSEGLLTMDSLNLSKKIYSMLTRIALSGGTYDDWLDATYTHERRKGTESPVYVGGLSKELVFQEVISNAQSEAQPLGSLAGRGIMAQKHKGGKVNVRIDEPSYIMGIVSITPRIDYSQGNKWDVNLKTMNDFHKPALDQIGYQDLITDQMAYWDTQIDQANGMKVITRSAGKQPAWINYTTNVNVVRGNFAKETSQMFMVLNRRYEAAHNAGANLYTIKDLTTYIDPTKFNHIFADTRIDAQNFWVQIKVDNTVRRKMSAKMIPNL